MWLAPAAVAVLAVLPIVLMLRRVVAEVVLLHREIDRFSELRPALLELRNETRALRLPRR